LPRPRVRLTATYTSQLAVLVYLIWTSLIMPPYTGHKATESQMQGQQESELAAESV
jgi:hypothetical protein